MASLFSGSSDQRLLERVNRFDVVAFLVVGGAQFERQAFHARAFWPPNPIAARWPRRIFPAAESFCACAKSGCWVLCECAQTETNANNAITIHLIGFISFFLFFKARLQTGLSKLDYPGWTIQAGLLKW